MIETKEIRVEGSPNGDKDAKKEYDEFEKEVEDCIAFGWQRTQETTRRSGRLHRRYLIMARETSMPNYQKYCELEEKYQNAKENIKKYQPIDFLTAFALLLILIIPGVIYIYFKMSQKEKIRVNNENCNKIMMDAIKEAKAL